MSPRAFKFGLALFIVMSGLFGAKLSLTAPGGLRAPWRSNTETASPAPIKPPAVQAVPAASPPPVSTQTGPIRDDVAAIAAVESAAHTAPPLSERDPSLVSAILLELKTRGYAIGSGTDLGQQSRAAILAYEADNDMRLTAEASQALLHRLLLGASGNEPNGGSPPTPRAEDVIRSIQTSLKSSGHPDLKIDGRMTSETAETIRAFERANAMKVTGRVSGELVARLQHVAKHASSGAGN